MEQLQEKANRGAPRQYTDQELMQIAFDVKHKKLKGAKVTYLLLEKHTRISRNTFKRRIGEYIESINKPIGRKVELHDRDPVYFPSIDEMFEIYKDKNLLMEKLHEFEMMFFDLYTDYEKLKEGSDKENELEQTIESLKKELAAEKENARNHERLYKQAVVSSTFEEKRRSLNIKDNLLKFENKKEDLDLTNLNTHFEIAEEPDVELDAKLNEDSKKNLKKFKRYSNLIDEE
ncbi:hypothetical protein [Bacillus sp. ISL-7]|uniref:hypothetical protein n=1 Tax=Bacillus sp. ISL-7 TaxID=2819136 RepID=UPI001BE903D0|nr:hypothetical protein [Bacillus sp. ISL-7]MBT2734720.1 hypothetical protein [Bacillus sp. ISL-7]